MFWFMKFIFLVWLRMNNFEVMLSPVQEQEARLEQLREECAASQRHLEERKQEQVWRHPALASLIPRPLLPGLGMRRGHTSLAQ